MSDKVEKLRKFVAFAKTLEGSEEKEDQVFMNEFFKAFGHEGFRQAGAENQYRIFDPDSKRTKKVDLFWDSRLILDMKSKGENLEKHLKQIREYWDLTEDNPPYAVLCNFDNFWIYNFTKQNYLPLDKVSIDELPYRYEALNFMFEENEAPKFEISIKDAASKDAADKVSQIYKSLAGRYNRDDAQLFVLQLLVAMFSANVGLLPKKSMVLEIAQDCLQDKKQSAYDLFYLLFSRMNEPDTTPSGRFQGVEYFNGGIFKKIRSLDLNDAELELIGGEGGIAKQDWSNIDPSIFGVIFQQGMDVKNRHARGVHYTSEDDILRILNPTIIEPWREQIENATNLEDLKKLRTKLLNFKVLDPACGCGNFLYLSFRELVGIEIELMSKMWKFTSAPYSHMTRTLISPNQFFGIDSNKFGVELTKVTLMIAKKLAVDEAREKLEIPESAKSVDRHYVLKLFEPLPLDDLDNNIIHGDALFTEWPEVDAIVGNPPFLTSNDMNRELGPVEVDKLRSEYKDVAGRVDYCVYWFRKAHDHLKLDQRAGLVGTKTIRETVSRKNGLEYILNNGGTITEAVSLQDWSGEAAVKVSIVNWKKGDQKGKKRIQMQKGAGKQSKLESKWVDEINSSLSWNYDVSSAKVIQINKSPTFSFVGQDFGHSGFKVKLDESLKILEKDPGFSHYLRPYLITSELYGNANVAPTHFVIDFHDASLLTAQKCRPLYKMIEKSVLPDRKKNADKEKLDNELIRKANKKGKIRKDAQRSLETWWQLNRHRGELIPRIHAMSRYIVCARTSTNLIFEFLSSKIYPNTSLIAFTFDDDYSFGILQSDVHYHWFSALCAHQNEAPRYSNDHIFLPFPWPQSVALADVKSVADAAAEFRNLRSNLRLTQNLSLRELHNSIENPAKSELKDAKLNLDNAVRKIYGMSESDVNYTLEFLLELNQQVIAAENNGENVISPGLPPCVKEKSNFVSKDCVTLPDNVLKLIGRN